MISSKSLLFAAIGVMLFLVIACALPFAITPVETEEKIVYVEVTPVVVETAPAAQAPVQAAPTATVSVPISLEGIWTIWQGSNEDELTINFLQQGFVMTANVATGNGHSMLFKGNLNQDNSSVTGTWESTNGSSGAFNMYLDGTGQFFSGNLGSGIPFCGARSNNPKPAVCLR